MAEPAFLCTKLRWIRISLQPPFSDKTWTTGLTPSKDAFQRFAWGVPSVKKGDYAFLLRIIRSMKSAGKAACILPHRVLFRGDAEAAIREQLVRSGYLKGIIGLPANLQRVHDTVPMADIIASTAEAFVRRMLIIYRKNQTFDRTLTDYDDASFRLFEIQGNEYRQAYQHHEGDHAKYPQFSGYARFRPTNEAESKRRSGATLTLRSEDDLRSRPHRNQKPIERLQIRTHTR